MELAYAGIVLVALAGIIGGVDMVVREVRRTLKEKRTADH